MLTALAPVDGDSILPLADARVHLNFAVGDNSQDADILSMRTDAIGLIEEHSRQSLQARQFRWDVDRFSPNMRLPIAPSQTVDDITYRNRDGVEVSLVSTDWLFNSGYLNAAGGLRWPLAGMGCAVVRITFTAGYVLRDEIPRHLMRAVKLAMAAMDEDRANPDLTVALRLANKFRRRTC